MKWNKRSLLGIIWLATALLLAGLNIGLAQDGSVLFSDDFEDGSGSEWTYWKTTHEILEVDGNHVFHLQNRADNWASTEIHLRNDAQLRWTNYAFEARIMFVAVDQNAKTPQLFINVRDSTTADKRSSYIGMVKFQPNSSGGSLGGWIDGELVGISPVEFNMVGPQMNTWHTIRLEANANELIFSLDGRLIQRAINDKVTRGGVSLEFPPGTEFYLDDVQITRLEEQEALVDTRTLGLDCTIPEPGQFAQSGPTLNVPAGVNVRSLASADFGLVTALPQTANVRIAGWFNAAGTPFESIAGGTWLVLHDGSYAVKASLVSVADAALVDVPQYQYQDGVFAAPVVAVPEEDDTTRFDVTYADFCQGELARTTQTVAVNMDTLMPVPFGLVKRGEYAAVDETLDALPDTGAVSGVLVRIYKETNNENSWYVLVAFSKKDGSWDTISVHALRDFTLRPVDNVLQSTDPPGQVLMFQTRTRISTNAVLAERTLHPGDHVILFYRETESGNGQSGCNGLPTTSDGITHLVDGGTCKLVNRPEMDGWVSADFKGLMYLND